MKPFFIVVATDEKYGIGKNGGLAWRLSADIKHFKELTTTVSSVGMQNAVIMGRKTWDSLPEKYKPLPGRINVILSQNSNIQMPSGVLLFSNLDSALKNLSSAQGVDKIFVIGGAQIYEQAILNSSCQDLFITEVKGNFNCDVFFLPIPASFKKATESPWATEGVIQFRFCRYQKA